MPVIVDITQALADEDADELAALIELITDWRDYDSTEINQVFRLLGVYGFSGRTDRYRKWVMLMLVRHATPDIHTCTLLMLNDEGKRQIENQPKLIDSVDANGSTALINAAERGNLEFVKLLCEFGANPDAVNHRGVTPMDAASHAGPWKEQPASDVVACLIKAGATLTFWKKAALGLQDELEVEIKAGMRDQYDEQGHPALFYAAKNNHLGCVNVLLMAGTDPAIVCDDGQTALSTACLHSLSGECDIEIVRALIEFGAPLSVAAAVILDDEEAVQRFVEQDPDILKDQHNESILGYAIHTWRPGIIRCLVDNGAEPNAENWAHIERIAGDGSLVSELKSARQK